MEKLFWNVWTIVSPFILILGFYKLGELIRELL